MMDQSPDALRASLSSENADHRFMAAYVAGERRFPWHREFIPLLTDTSDAVRQAARRCLIIESYLALNPDEAAVWETAGKNTPPPPTGPTCSPVDFGPGSDASPAAQRKAVGLWTEWWAEKRSSAGWVGGQPLVPAEFNADNDSNHLAAPFLIAGPGRKTELIALYRDAEGSGYSEALAAAITRTPTDDRVELREALAARMTRVTEETLRQRLDSRLSEFRRAAVLELARRENSTYGERITILLLDSDPAVQRAARAALCQLSGQDFGPKHDATDSERTLAVNQWRSWWKKNRPQ